ncbi:MAG: TolC family protein [Flavobacteriaceae bacterium]|nr:TolC family protein [Flavobacteriaceae bacterium]
MKTTFLLLTSLLYVSLGFSQKKWTLRECVEHALENNITVQQNVLNVELNQEDMEISKGNFLPSVNASSGSNVSSGLSPDEFGVLRNTNNLNTNFNLSVNGTIFNGFRNLNSYKQAQLGIRSGELDLKRVQNDISLLIVNGYLNVLFAKENLSVAKVQADISKKQVSAAKDRFTAGIIPKGDLLNVTSTAANDQQNVVIQENVLTIALLNLAQLLQVPADGFDVQDINVGTPLAVLLYENANKVYKKALTTQPQITRAELGLKNADLNIEIAKGAFLPTLTYSVGASTSYFNQFNNLLVFPDGTRQTNDNFFSQLSDRFRYGVSLNLNIPIFNRLQTKNTIERAQVSKVISELNLTNEKLQLQQTIEQAYADTKAALKTYEAAKVSLEAQQEAFKNAQESFNLGAMSIFDFDLVRNRFVNAQSTLIRNKFDFIFKTKVLQFYYGELNLD